MADESQKPRPPKPKGTDHGNLLIACVKITSYNQHCSAPFPEPWSFNSCQVYSVEGADAVIQSVQLFVLFERRDWVDRNGSGRVKGSGAAFDDSWPKLPHATTACGAPNCAFELIVWATRPGVHARESCKAKTGRSSERLAVEQLVALREGRERADSD